MTLRDGGLHYGHWYINIDEQLGDTKQKQKHDHIKYYKKEWTTADMLSKWAEAVARDDTDTSRDKQ